MPSDIALNSTPGIAQIPPMPDSALRHARRMFYHDNVTRHQVGRRNARELIIGEVPRLDAIDDAKCLAYHHGLTFHRIERPRREEVLGFFGIIGEDVR